MYTKIDLINDIKKAGITSNDTIMIHSSFKSLGEVDGGVQTVIDAFTEVVNDGLLIFPTHTWATMKNVNMIFDKKTSDPCVGIIPTYAYKTPGFIRSNHPTHSVCAYGKYARDYINYDNDSTTPANPNGCFGKLKDMNAKILFLGAPLSKNTFIHSIEEEMNVPDRFTDHIYTFKSLQENGEYKIYKMPRHYSTKSDHISDHYEKLIPILLLNNIATKVKIGDSTSYVVEAKKCHDLVVKLLTKNIHIFDDFKEIDPTI
jgi:aminoglycoside 3-N-acetyltransferase